MQSLENKIKDLPVDLYQEVEDYIDFLVQKRGNQSKKQFVLTWKGALRDDRNPISSVDLQHKVLDWWQE